MALVALQRLIVVVNAAAHLWPSRLTYGAAVMSLRYEITAVDTGGKHITLTHWEILN